VTTDHLTVSPSKPSSVQFTRVGEGGISVRYNKKEVKLHYSLVSSSSFLQMNSAFFFIASERARVGQSWKTRVL
jgi:hypothetical protein